VCCAVIASYRIITFPHFFRLEFLSGNLHIQTSESRERHKTYNTHIVSFYLCTIAIRGCNESRGRLQGTIESKIPKFKINLLAVLLLQAKFASQFPLGLLGAIAVVGGLVALTLPETANKPLINTIQEGEEKAR